MAARAAARAEAARRPQPRSMRRCFVAARLVRGARHLGHAGDRSAGWSRSSITLVDFVEEDVSRKLPASERVTHTLLALNYGAILALLLAGPDRLGARADRARPGLVRLVQPACRAGGAGRHRASDCATSSPRDAAERLVLGQMRRPGRGRCPGRQHVLVTGATGFIGRRLVEALDRGRPSGHRAGARPGKRPRCCGRRSASSPASTRFRTTRRSTPSSISPASRSPTACGRAPSAAAFSTSRVRMTRAVVRLIERLDRRPALLISGSAIGWYGSWQDEAADRVRRRQALLHATASARPGSARR